MRTYHAIYDKAWTKMSKMWHLLSTVKIARFDNEALVSDQAGVPYQTDHKHIMVISHKQLCTQWVGLM